MRILFVLMLMTLRVTCFSVSSSSDSVRRCSTTTIVGGGLAGLSTAIHLLEKSDSSVRVDIVDRHNVGCGGASSVAGGLVHPLSPRGKLVHWGQEGLAATSRLVDIASRHADCVLSSQLYRVALSDDNVQAFRETAKELPNLCYWMDPDGIREAIGSDSDKIRGGLCLHNKGCQAIHVPTYLQGLWEHCVEEYPDRVGWTIVSDTKKAIKESADGPVVLCAGAALWQDGILDAQQLPTQLVRGQSLELTLPESAPPVSPILFGKYTSPMPKHQQQNHNRVLLGATHEFDEEPWSEERVKQELRDRSYDALPHVWDDDRVTIDRITVGTRVQTSRGAFGRIPLVGKLSQNQWIFTGLSSRGLLHHGIYGEILAEAILNDDEKGMMDRYPHLSWWKS